MSGDLTGEACRAVLQVNRRTVASTAGAIRDEKGWNCTYGVLHIQGLTYKVLQLTEQEDGRFFWCHLH